MKTVVSFVVSVCLWGALSTSTYAAARSIGLIIIGADAEYKTQGYCQYAKKKLNPKNGEDYVVVVGDDAQSKYLEYWVKKGFVTIQPLLEEDYTAFVEASGFDKVIYLIFDNYAVVHDPTHYTSSGMAYTQEGITEGSVDAYAVLCSKERPIDEFDMQKESGIIGDGHDSKQTLFQKCIRDIAQRWHSLF